MTKVIYDFKPSDSPREAMLRDYLATFATGDTDALLAFLREDVHWELIGRKVLKGKKETAEALQEMAGDVAQEMVIKSIITNGVMASADGTMILADGSKLAFCDVYEFNSTDPGDKIGVIRSYSIVLQ